MNIFLTIQIYSVDRSPLPPISKILAKYVCQISERICNRKIRLPSFVRKYKCADHKTDEKLCQMSLKYVGLI